MSRTLSSYQYSFFLAVAIICLTFVFGDPVDAGMREDSLLLTGARSQQLSIVRASLKQGADVNARDELGRTPLMWSAFHGSVTILEILIARGADVNAQDKMGRTALVWAAITGRENTAVRLVGAGADMSTGDSSGLNASERASEEGHFSLADRLKNMVPPEK